MRDSEIEEDLAGGSFLDDPRMKTIYLSKTPKERREMAEYFSDRRLLGLDGTPEKRKEAYDQFFDMEQMALGCEGCLFGIFLLIVVVAVISSLFG